MENVRQ